MKATGLNSRASWLATMACTLISFLIMMPAKLSGLIFVEMLGRYNTDRAMASYPLILSVLVRCSGGPLTGYCGERFGLYSVIVAGCVFSALGVGVCFFAEDMITVIIFLGLVYGVGLTFSMTLFAQVLKQHFDKNLTLAISMSMFGSCFGGFIIPPLIKWIFQSYGVSGTFLIMGGIMLNSLPFAMLLRYLKPKKKSAQKEAKPSVAQTKSPASVTATAALKSAESGKKRNVGGKEEFCGWELRDCSNNKLLSSVSTREVDGEKLAKHYTSLNNRCQTNSKLANGKNSLEQSTTLLPESEEPVLANGKDRLEQIAPLLPKSDESVLVNGKDTLEQTVPLLPKSDESVLANGKDTLEQTVPLLPKSDESVPANPEKSVSTEAKPVVKKPVSKQKAALQSLTIFLDWTFLNMVVTQSSEVIVQMLTLTTMLDYSRDKGIDRGYEVYFLMSLPLAEVFGRVALSMIIDRDYISKLNFTIVSFNILAATVLVIAWAKTFAVMMVGVVAFGLVTSGLLSVFPMLVFQFIEPKNYIMALASKSFLYGPMSLLCPPLIGYFRGTLGSYDWVYYIQAILSVVCALMTVFIPHCGRRRDRIKDEKREKKKLKSMVSP